jgi:hypothetical protein
MFRKLIILRKEKILLLHERPRGERVQLTAGEGQWQNVLKIKHKISRKPIFLRGKEKTFQEKPKYIGI